MSWTPISISGYGYQWTSVTSNSNGKQLAACTDDGIIIIFKDNVTAWEKTTSTIYNNGVKKKNASFRSISSNGAGDKLVVCADFDAIYYSIDYGETWNNAIVPQTYWNCVTVNENGNKCAACSTGGEIYLSNDGITWYQSTTSPSGSNWYSINISKDGNLLAICENNGSIYYSIDSGVNWTQGLDNTGALLPNLAWRTITSNYNGTLLAASTNNSVYYSINSGANWTNGSLDTTNIPDLRVVTSNYSGTQFALCSTDTSSFSGKIFISTNPSAWNTSSVANGNWRSITSNYNGNRLAACMYYSFIYIYTGESCITVTEPSNKTYYIGETMLIEWSGGIPPYTISLYNDAFVKDIGVTSDTSYNWIINVGVGDYRIYIYDYQGCANFSAEFTVIPCEPIIFKEPSKLYYFIGDSLFIEWLNGNSPYTLTISHKGNIILSTSTTNTNFIWPINVAIGIYKICITDAGGCTGCKEFLALPLQDICFVKDTLVETDQGDIPIQSLVVGKHTIFNQKIMELTTTIHIDSHLVRIAPFAFGTYPTKETIVSQEHKINGDNSFRKARDYVNGTTVTLIPYEQEPLYNVVLIKHGFMKVHGMMVETLDPYVAKHRPKHPLQLK
jgi:hypothetical protein